MRPFPCPGRCRCFDWGKSMKMASSWMNCRRNSSPRSQFSLAWPRLSAASWTLHSQAGKIHRRQLWIFNSFFFSSTIYLENLMKFQDSSFRSFFNIRLCRFIRKRMIGISVKRIVSQASSLPFLKCCRIVINFLHFRLSNPTRVLIGHVSVVIIFLPVLILSFIDTDGGTKEFSSYAKDELQPRNSSISRCSSWQRAQVSCRKAWLDPAFSVCLHSIRLKNMWVPIRSIWNDNFQIISFFPWQKI